MGKKLNTGKGVPAKKRSRASGVADRSVAKKRPSPTARSRARAQTPEELLAIIREVKRHRKLTTWTGKPNALWNDNEAKQYERSKNRLWDRIDAALGARSTPKAVPTKQDRAKRVRRTPARTK